MKNLGIWMTTLALGAAMTAGTALGAAPVVKNRQIHQQRRIGHGVRSGELTRPEARHLERNAARIHRSIRRDRIDGGVFTPRERAQAQHKLNQQSRRIARQKHDGQSRN